MFLARHERQVLKFQAMNKLVELLKAQENNSALEEDKLFAWQKLIWNNIKDHCQKKWREINKNGFVKRLIGKDV